MPTIILLDVSLSMIRPILNAETGDTNTILQLASQGINFFLDYLSAHLKLEYAALITFSSLYEIVSPFTRDFDSIKLRLSKVEEHDKTCLETGLHGVHSLIVTDWGTSIPCQVILVTDGSAGVGQMSLKQTLSSLSHNRPQHFPLPFPFPCKLHVVCISPPHSPGLSICVPLYQRLVEVAGSEVGTVFVPESGPLTIRSVQNMFQKLCDSNFSAFYGNLKCGNLCAKISLSPSPQPYTKVTDFESITKTFSDTIEVCGFLDVTDVGSPMAISRHLVIPHSTGKPDGSGPRLKIEGDSDDEIVDEGKIPSFCVLLHGALKVENMAALCTLNEDWFGMLYSWADSKKKSNLMLTVLEPGSDSVPWLGDLNHLGSLEEYTSLGVQPGSDPPAFPVKPSERRSYSQNVVVWIRQAGLQSDIQKILRHARKLPEKTQQFYKELNRVRRAAICFGFVELLDCLAFILDRECTLLPGTAHPDCALQLNHAASVLKRNYSKDIKFNITALKTKFNNEHE